MRPDLGHLIGVPFLDGGRTLAGMDCWGLVTATFAAYGIDLPDYGISLERHGADEVDETMRANAHLWERTDAPVPPALFVLRFHPKYPEKCTHAATLVETLQGNRILHAMRKTHSCLQRPTHLFFKGRIEGYFQWRG